MTILVPIALFGWVPAVLLLFLFFPARRAVIFAFIVAWLFLPAATFKLPGIPDYSKMTATCIGVLFGTLIFDSDSLMRFRLRWFDLPMIVWCCCPFGTNYAENIDMYDSMSWIFSQTVTWALPYFIGRVYFTEPMAVRELAVALFVAGLIYVPICLFEVRMSPVLAIWVYGFQGGYSGRRLGGWRPHGFLGSGLMLGMWMTSASLMGIWLWFTGSLRKLRGYSITFPLLVLLGTTVLCRSTGAMLLLGGGTAVLLAIRYTRNTLPFLLLATVAFVYPVMRTSGSWDGTSIVDLARTYIDPDRAQSIEFRLKNEDLLIQRALERPVWGWGRFGGNRVHDRDGRDITITDGLWIIALGTMGAVGLMSATLIYIVPGLCFWWRARARDWAHPDIAGAAAFAVILVLYSIDNLLNAMINPICMLCAGALAGMRVQYSAPTIEASPKTVETATPTKSRVERALWPPPRETVPAREAVSHPHVKWDRQ